MDKDNTTSELVESIDPGFFSLIPVPIETIISTFILVLAIDRVFFKNKLQMQEDRKWILPLISIFCGSLMHVLQYQVAFNTPGIKKIIFTGIQLGALTTVIYRIAKDLVYDKLKMLSSFGKMQVAENE